MDLQTDVRLHVSAQPVLTIYKILPERACVQSVIKCASDSNVGNAGRGNMYVARCNCTCCRQP